MKALLSLFARFREVILYGAIGAFSASVDFGVYTLLCLAMPYLVANVASVHCGIFCSFYLNRRYNFRVEDKAARRFASFYIVGLLGLLLSEALIFVLVEMYGCGGLPSKLSTIVVVAAFQYVLNKFITFKR